MFKKVLIFSLFGVVLLGMPLQAQLADGNFGLDETAEKAAYKQPGKPVPASALFDKINAVISGLLGITAILFFGLLTFGGVRWMTAHGNEEFVEKAKNTVEAAIIGLVIITSAYAITNFVFKKITEQAPAGPTPAPAPSGCVVIKTAADCQAPACHWNRVTSSCEEASSQQQGTFDCAQFVEGQQSECVAAGCSWVGTSCIASVSEQFGICLRVISGQLYCEPSTQSGCDTRGGGYSFYQGKDETDCAAQQSSYLPLPDPGSCIDQRGTCVEGGAGISACSGKVVNLPGCSPSQVCCQ